MFFRAHIMSASLSFPMRASLGAGGKLAQGRGPLEGISLANGFPGWRFPGSPPPPVAVWRKEVARGKPTNGAWEKLYVCAGSQANNL